VDALVLDGSQRAALVAVRSLGRAGFRVGTLESARFGRTASSVSRFCAYSATLPDAIHASGEHVNALVASIEELCPKAVIPVHDATVSLLRTSRSVIGVSTGVALPDEAALNLLVDKRKTLALATQLGIRIPRGESTDDVESARMVARQVGFPVVLKPVESWVERDGISTRLAPAAVSSDDELARTAEQMFAAGARLLVQEWLQGAREAVSVMCADGRVVARFAQVAYRTSPPLGGSSVLRVSIPLPPDAARAADQLAEAARLDGYGEVEFRRDREGHAVLMEVNPRLSASVEIAVRSGVDFPLLVYLHAVGAPVTAVPGYRENVRMRWLGGDLLWLRSILRHGGGGPDMPRPSRALAAFAADFFRRTGYDYIARDDWRPALVASSNMARATIAGWRRPPSAGTLHDTGPFA
jgi:predicted ATP-grasp superfamily ATP-dependent carboligase